MKISKKIHSAIVAVVTDKDGKRNQAELARKIGVSEATISRYINKKTDSVDDEVWERLKPILSPHVDIDNDDEIFKDEKEVFTACPLCSALNPVERGVVEMYKALESSKKILAQQKIEKLSRVEPYTVEDRINYLYCEYDGDFDPVKYEDYVVAIKKHAKFRKVPVLQRCNFEIGIESILHAASAIYQKHISNYEHRWAVVVEWEVMRKIEKQWDFEASAILVKRRMFSEPQYALAWLLDKIPDALVEAEDMIRHLSESKIIKTNCFIKELVADRSVSGGGRV